MPLAVRSFAVAVLIGVAAGLPAQVREPDPKALKAQFQTEREDALKAKFPADALARADDLAKRGDAAVAAGDPKAARYFRDARWQLPYLPADLPPHVVRVLGESRMRHADRVNAVAYSPDGTKLASASRDGTVKVWDLGNGRDLVTYRGHADQTDDPSKGTNVLRTGDVVFSPDGKVVASASGTQVHLWDPGTGKLVKVLVKVEKTDKPLKAIAFRPDGKFLAVAGDDGIVRTYDVETGKNAFTSPPRNARIESLAYSPNGNMIVVGDSASQVAVYAPGAANPLAMGVQGVRSGETLGVGFTLDNAGVFACGKEGTIQLFAGPNPDGTGAANTSTRLREFTGHTDSVNALVVTPDGKTLVTAGTDRTVRVWDVTSAKPLRSFQGHLTKVLALAVRGDGRQIASASDDGAIRLWDLNTTDDHRALAEATDSLWAVAFSPDGKRVATAGADKTVRVYDPETGKLEVALPGGHTSAITSLAFFPDGNKLASAGGDRVVKVWDVAAKKVVAEMPGHESAVLAVAVGSEGKLIASGAADRTVRGWADGKQAWAWSGKSAVCAVAIRKGEKFVAAGTADGTLVVLDVTGGTPKELFAQSAHLAGVACVAYSPDGNRVATVGGDGAVRVWAVTEAGSLTALTKFDGQIKTTGTQNYSPLTGLSFSPDGRYVAAVGADMVVRVWDIQTKSEARGLRGHTDWVTAVAFSPDGRLLASVGVDKAARVFELPAQESSAAGGHLLKVNAVAVSHDGKYAVTAATDQTMKVWDLATGREVATLIGNTDIPQAVTFLGADGVVMGGQLQGNEAIGQLHFWGTKPPRRNKMLSTGAVYAVAGTADGKKLAAWSTKPAVGQQSRNTTYELYDAAGELLGAVADKGRTVTAAAFSPDLAWAAGGDDQGVVRVWDLDKKERVKGDWPLFATAVADLGVTPDKKLLVAMDAKGLVKVANTETREALGSVAALKGPVRGLVVSPTGDTFVAFSADREVRAWSLSDPKQPKEVRAWALGVGVSGVAYTPDGKQLVTANADGTAFVLQLP